MITKRTKNCFRKFFGWGGLTAISAYVLDGHLEKALLIALIIGAAVALDEYYSS
jgi:hypothetical protein